MKNRHSPVVFVVISLPETRYYQRNPVAVHTVTFSALGIAFRKKKKKLLDGNARTHRHTHTHKHYTNDLIL